MKSNPVLLLVFMVAATELKAQSIRHFDISYAPTLASISITGDKLKQHRWGHQMMAELSLSKSSRFSFKTGIGFSFLQAEYFNEITSSGTALSTWHRYYDILLPFHLKYGFSDPPNRFYATIGIVPSINVGRKVLEFRPAFGSWSRDVSQDQDFNQLDFPLSAGLGYSFTDNHFRHYYIQPTIRTNIGTEFYYLLRYLFGRRSSTNDDPPGWTSIGLTLGYAW